MNVVVTRRTAKSKGAQFEYEVRDTLEQYYKNKNINFNVNLTKELGFVAQYDIKVWNEDGFGAVECKFHKTISWNQAKKYFLKLESAVKDATVHMLVYKSNQQPVLFMIRNTQGNVSASEFETYTGIKCQRYS